MTEREKLSFLSPDGRGDSSFLRPGECGTSCFLRPGERLDDLERGGYRIIQNPSGFCFGMDAVLLSGFAADEIRSDEKILDLGTGSGVIPILLEARTRAKDLTGLEILPECADMARRSVALNRLEDKISIVCGDIREAGGLFPAASFDVVTCNPPYMIGKHGIRNPEEPKAVARHEILCTFADVAEQAEKLLRPGGALYLVHRPFRLAEIMVTLAEHKLEPKRMRLVYPYADREPNLVLLKAVRGGRPRLSVERPLIIQERPGMYTQEIRVKYGF